MYIFPLPSDTAVCAFSAVIDNARTVKGEAKERAQAKREYDQAVRAGKTAALLQQHSTQGKKAQHCTCMLLVELCQFSRYRLAT